MGFSTLFIFALLQISLLFTGVNSTTYSSNHRLARAPHLDHSVHAKKKDQSILDSSTFLELSKEPVPIFIEDEPYYICISGTCDDVKIEVIPSADKKCTDAYSLVNKDNFEMLEWNTWEDVHNGQIPVKPVFICKNIYITKEKQKIGAKIRNFFKKTDIKTEILTLNNDIILQRLEIDHYETEEEMLSNTSQVIKEFKVENRNCVPVKHVVKLDQGRDRSISFLKGQTRTTGKTGECSITGKIAKVVDIGGKFSVKYEKSRMISETTSSVDKDLHSVNMEIQVPPNQSCSVVISSNTVWLQVPYFGQLIRRYKEYGERITNIADMYDYQEVAELLTSVIPCTPLPDGVPC